MSDVQPLFQALESIEVAQQHLQAGRNPAKSLLLDLGDQGSETTTSMWSGKLFCQLLDLGS